MWLLYACHFLTKIQKSKPKEVLLLSAVSLHMEWFDGYLSQLFVMYPSFMVELQTVSHLSVILYTKKETHHHEKQL